MRYFYSTYVAHAMRFYLKYPDVEEFRSEADKINHNLARTLINSLPESEREEVTGYYLDGVAEDWNMIRQFEREWAKKRGLI